MENNLKITRVKLASEFRVVRGERLLQEGDRARCRVRTDEFRTQPLIRFANDSPLKWSPLFIRPLSCFDWLVLTNHWIVCWLWRLVFVYKFRLTSYDNFYDFLSKLSTWKSFGVSTWSQPRNLWSQNCDPQSVGSFGFLWIPRSNFFEQANIVDIVAVWHRRVCGWTIPEKNGINTFDRKLIRLVHIEEVW